MCYTRPSSTGLGDELWARKGLAYERKWPSGGSSPSRLRWGKKFSNNRLAAKDVGAASVRRAGQQDAGAALVAA